MISQCTLEDFNLVHEIINDGARAYKGIIPEDRWHDPYMTRDQLHGQISEGVQFWKYAEGGAILGVMGLQVKESITLIRHAYVRTMSQGQGIGTKLLEYLCTQCSGPILIGTWADADWAIRFYQKHGFKLLPTQEKNDLLRMYWTIPERQIETSVVLANSGWLNR